MRSRKTIQVALGIVAAALLGSAATAPPVHGPQSPSEIRAVIARMQDAWNRGDFEGYMQGFWNPDVTFVSGGRIIKGWKPTLDHYVRDYDTPEKRGRLTFCDLDIQMLAPDAAQLVGHYDLERVDKAQHGVNTRLFRKIGGRWVIVLNHVSSLDPPGRRQCPDG